MGYNMQAKIYDYLPQEAIDIRTAVFINEQAFQDEFDDIDEKAIHIVLCEDNKPIAVCRVYYSEDKKCYAIGRIAVMKEYRGKAYGAKVVQVAEDEIQKRSGNKIGLSAQERVRKFYEKLGYKKYGDIYFDEGCPHIWMEKTL